MATTYDVIETQTLGSAATTVTFSSIPATYTDLILIVNGTVSSSSNSYIRFNSDAGSNYSDTLLYGTGSGSPGSERNATQTRVNAGNMYASTMNTSIVHIFNYTNTNVYKTIFGRWNSAANIVGATGGLWRSTSAITSITLSLLSSYTFSANDTFTLYGVKSK